MVKIGFARATIPGYMAPSYLGGEQLQRLVEQAVARVCSPDERETIISTALAAAGEPAIPSDDAGRLAAFVFGSLRDAVEETMGLEPATTVVRSLTPLLKRKSELEKKSKTEAQKSQEQEAPEEQVRAEPPAPQGQEEEEQTTSGGPTILIVDDDMMVRAQLGRLLRSHGYNVVIAPDGHVALAVCVRRRPDLVISELHMKGMEGRQLVALMKVAFGSKAPPVVILTDDDEAIDDKSDDVACVLHKPIGQEELIAALEPLFSPRSAQP